MLWPFIALSLLCLSTNTVTTQRIENDNQVVIAFIIEENSACILPYFLGTLDRLTYPKEKITLWIRVDANSTSSVEDINKWTEAVRHQYHNVDYAIFKGITEELSSLTHDDVILSLREEALLSAKQHDYIIFIEPDLAIENLEFIDDLIDSSIVQRADVIAPMLNVGNRENEEQLDYYNFWEDISDEGGQVITETSTGISERSVKGCFRVSLVHSFFMVDVRSPVYNSLSFNHTLFKRQEVNKNFNLVGFSKSALSNGANIKVCNNKKYGEIYPPADWFENGDEERKPYLQYKLRKSIWSSATILPSEHVTRKPSQISKDFDMVYIINLKKRAQRRVFMEHIVYELGLQNYQFFDAVDGKQLNDSYLAHLQVSTLPGYKEPYDDRTYLTRGEIGCFLSHYFIWEEAREKGYKSILILEDDAEPVPDMLSQYKLVSAEMKSLNGNWDLLYLGRSPVDETVLKTSDIEGLEHLVSPGYSYWTVAYALSDRGINKVLSHKPLSKMLPSDIYLNILYDMHANEEWKNQFSPRNLVALSASPRLIFPALFPGDDNFVSDTSFEVPEHDEL